MKIQNYPEDIKRIAILAVVSISLIMISNTLIAWKYVDNVKFLSIVIVIGSAFTYALCILWLLKRQEPEAKELLKNSLWLFIPFTFLYIVQFMV
jgi:hypothetical protein